MRKGNHFIYLCDCAGHNIHFTFSRELEYIRPGGSAIIEDGWIVVSLEPNASGFWDRFRRMWTYLFKPRRFFDGGEMLSELNTEENKAELRGLIAFLQEALIPCVAVDWEKEEGGRP